MGGPLPLVGWGDPWL